MKSPFPGMDPYLEDYWSDVHSRLATYSCDYLNRQMPRGMRARIQESIAVESDDRDPVTYFPDVTVSHLSSPFTPGTAFKQSPTSSALIVRLRPDPEIFRSVRIETASGNKLVTAIEFLSPSNKHGDANRESYKRKRNDILASSASTVEIDLLRAGPNVTAVSLKQVKLKYRKNRKAVVVRGWDQTWAEVYFMTMRQALPKINIPLRKEDADIVLDLQSILDQVYENGLYDTIDYTCPLENELMPQDEAWVDELLKNAKKR